MFARNYVCVFILFYAIIVARPRGRHLVSVAVFYAVKVGGSFKTVLKNFTLQHKEVS